MKTDKIKVLQKPEIGKEYERLILVDQVRASEDDQELVDFSFSSETPVERWGYIEILDHSESAVNLERFNKKAINVLFNHDPDKVIGIVEEAYLDVQEKKLRGRVRFSKSELAQEKKRDVLDGILRNVSIGYVIDEIRLESEEKNGPSTYRVTRWTPYEVSLVSIPADPNVGYKRTTDLNISGVTNNKIEEGDSTMLPKDIQVKDEPKFDNQKRAAEIEALGKKFNVPYKWAVKNENVSVEAFRDYVLDHITNSKPVVTDELGLSKKEKEEYSLVRGIISVIEGKNSFEREISEELAVKYNRPVDANSLIVPHEVLRRDLTVGGTGTGAELKAVQFAGNEFIDVLRNKMVTYQLGVRMLTGLEGDVYIPKLATGSTWGWKPESGSFSESTPTTAQIVLKPKEGGTYVDYSKRLLYQSSPSVDQIVMNDLTQLAALGLDKAILKGAGTNEPTGITNTTGVNSVTAASLTYAKALEFIRKVMAANALSDNCAWVGSPVGWETLKGRAKASGYPEYIISDDNTLAGYPFYATAQVGDAELIFGDFTQVILALWGGVELTIDPYTQSTYNLIRVVVSQLADVAVRYPRAFSVATDLS